MAALRVLIAGGSPRTRENIRGLLASAGAVQVVESPAECQVILLDLTDGGDGGDPPNGRPVLALLGESVGPAATTALWSAGVSCISDGVSREGLVASLEAAARGLQVRDRPAAGRQVPVRAEPATTADPGVLTDREREILRLLGEGLGNREMAQALGVSDHTVKFHLNSIFRKLGARSRTEAVSLAVRGGLLML